MAPAVAERAFELKDGEVSEPIRTPQGFRVHHRDGHAGSRRAEARRGEGRCATRCIKQKAIEAARQKAAAIAAQMKTGDFAAAAKAAGLEVKTTDLIARGAPIGGRRHQPGGRRGRVRAAARRG